MLSLATCLLAVATYFKSPIKPLFQLFIKKDNLYILTKYLVVLLQQ